MSSKGRILMAMSGGLDSSVSAILLKEQGYDVVGVTMKLWNYPPSCSLHSSACCDVDAINDARQLAVSLDIPHFVLDFTKEFKDIVIDNFISEYLQARTPNPCILCNIHLKWKALIEKAKQLDCSAIATGHYARIKYENGRYFVSKAKDATKDQSYVLWGLSQDNLAKTIFPLGDYTKAEIRKIAQAKGFVKLAQKRESYDICFIPDNQYRDFLKEHVSDIEQRMPCGNFLDTNGNVVGKHKGIAYYTIGQRKGLEVAFGVPKYVCRINSEDNTITLGDKADLLSTKMQVRSCVFSKYEQIPADFEAETKIRYRDYGHKSLINQKGDELNVTFIEPASAITPGQSAVIYEGDDVVAGGFIDICE
ncbi:MAG: tRNA 2-thiouridine(34) synthase MnmA [Bacteroidales bacterium]|nr:tRNA 2-thiouridine(34) synthase MnmA [Bacteroidales bacterium]